MGNNKSINKYNGNKNSRTAQKKRVTNSHKDSDTECDHCNRTFLDRRSKNRHTIKYLANKYLSTCDDEENVNDSVSDEDIDEFEEKYEGYVCKVCHRFCDSVEDCTKHRIMNHRQFKNNKELFQKMFVTLLNDDVPQTHNRKPKEREVSQRSRDQNNERKQSKDSDKTQVHPNNEEPETSQEYQTLYKCTICQETLESEYKSIKHREKFHPLTKHKRIFDKIPVPINKHNTENSSINMNTTKRTLFENAFTKGDIQNTETCKSNGNSCYENKDCPSTSSGYSPQTKNINKQTSSAKNTPELQKNLAILFICGLCKYVAKTPHEKYKHRLLEHRDFCNKNLFKSYFRIISKAKESIRKTDEKNKDSNTPTRTERKRQNDDASERANSKKVRIDRQTPENANAPKSNGMKENPKVDSSTPKRKRNHNGVDQATPKKVRIDSKTPEKRSARLINAKMRDRSKSVDGAFFQKREFNEKCVTTPKLRRTSLGHDVSKSDTVKITSSLEIYVCKVCSYVAETKSQKNKHVMHSHADLEEETVFQTYISKSPDVVDEVSDRTKSNPCTPVRKQQYSDGSEKTIPKKTIIDPVTVTPQRMRYRSNSVDLSPSKGILFQKNVNTAKPRRKSLGHSNLEDSIVKKFITVYQCKGCFTCFISLDVINAHLDKCSKPDCRKCDWCELSFTKDDLEIHVQRDHIDDVSIVLNVILLPPHLVENKPSKNVVNFKDKDSKKTNEQSEEPQREMNNENQMAKVKLYQCNACECCFIDLPSLSKHLKHNNHNKFLHTCSECNYKFSRQTLLRHESEHHNVLGLQRDNFEIITQAFPTNIKENVTDITNSSNVICSKTVMPSKVPLDETTKSKAESNSDEDDTIDSNDDKNTPEQGESDQEDWTPKMKDHDLPPAMKTSSRSKSGIKIKIRRMICKFCSKPFLVKYPQKRLVCDGCRSKAQVSIKRTKLPSREVESTIYQCRFCNVNFTKLGPIKTHIRIEAHSDGAEDIIQCIKDGCGLKFSRSSYTYHRKIHHEKLNLKSTEYNVIVLPKDNNLLLRMSIQAIQGGHLSRKDGRLSNFVINEMYREKRRKLYKCLKCEKHFVFRRSFINHMNGVAHNSSTNVNCETCGLAFSTGMLTKHKKIQHENLSFGGPEDFIIYDSVSKVLRRVTKNSVGKKSNVMVQIHNATDPNVLVCDQNSCNNNKNCEKKISQSKRNAFDNNMTLNKNIEARGHQHDNQQCNYYVRVNPNDDNFKTLPSFLDTSNNNNNNNNNLKETPEFSILNVVGSLDSECNRSASIQNVTSNIKEFDEIEEQSDMSQDEENERHEITFSAEVHNEACANTETEEGKEENIKSNPKSQERLFDVTVQVEKPEIENQNSKITKSNVRNFLIEDEETRKLFPNSFDFQNNSFMLEIEHESVDVIKDDQTIGPTLSESNKINVLYLSQESEKSSYVSNIHDGVFTTQQNSINNEQQTADVNKQTSCVTSDDKTQAEALNQNQSVKVLSSASTQYTETISLRSRSSEILMNVDNLLFNFVDQGIEVTENSQEVGSDNSYISGEEIRSIYAITNEHSQVNIDTIDNSVISHKQITSKNLTVHTQPNITLTNIETNVNPNNIVPNNTTPLHGNETTLSTHCVENLHLKINFESDNTKTGSLSLAAAESETTNKSKEEVAPKTTEIISYTIEEEDDDVSFVPNPENVIVELLDSDDEVDQTPEPTTNVEQFTPIQETVKKEKCYDIRRYFMSSKGNDKKDKNIQENFEDVSNILTKKEKTVFVTKTNTTSAITIELSDSDDEITNIVIRQGTNEPQSINLESE